MVVASALAIGIDVEAYPAALVDIAFQVASADLEDSPTLAFALASSSVTLVVPALAVIAFRFACGRTELEEDLLLASRREPQSLPPSVHERPRVFQ